MTNLFPLRNRGFIQVLLLTAMLLASAQIRAADHVPEAIKKLKQLSAKNTAALQHRLASPVSVPGNSMNYFADSLAGWIHYSNSKYAYNQRQQLVSRADADAVTGDSLEKMTFAFDARNNLTEALYYSWQNNAWELSMGSIKNQYSYNSSNQITDQIQQYYNTGAGQFENANRGTVLYDQNGNIIEEMEMQWQGTGWDTTYRVQYLYNASNTITEMLIQEYQGGIFENVNKITDVVWYDFQAYKPAGYTEYFWTFNTWEPVSRVAISYDVNGGSVAVYEGYENGSWLQEWRDTELYDIHANFTGFISESWNGTAWETDYQIEEVLTYDANLNITERIYRDMFNTSGTLENVYREVYSNFTTVLSIAQPANLPVTVYPNPAQNSISVAGEVSGPVTIAVSDVTGRQVLSATVSQPSESVNISRLTSGTYFVRVTSKTEIKTTKLIKL